MTDNIFSSKEVFRHHFEQGLVNLLQNDELGVFILSLANASFDQHAHDYTEGALLTSYHHLRNTYKKALRNGQQLKVPDDDLMVFLKLLSISIDHIKSTEFRDEGIWQLQFNHIRSLRPSRMAQSECTGIHQPFDPNGFNFNKPFLQKEIFWQGELLNKDMSIFYNKFPFVRFHSLLVPDKERGINQFLTKEYHEYIWAVGEYLTANLPGLGIAYNSNGAGSSVNHLHFHLYIKDHPLPLFHENWSHNPNTANKEQQPYPIQCEIFDDIDEAWNFIQILNVSHIAYNLIYQDSKLYCLVRQHQGDSVLPEWCNGLGWHEVCGSFTTFNYNDFSKMQEQTLFDTLAALKIATIKR